MSHSITAVGEVLPMHPGLVAIFFMAVQAGRGRSPVLVAQNGLPPMHPGPAKNAGGVRRGTETKRNDIVA
jgi:hypothetical protein